MTQIIRLGIEARCLPTVQESLVNGISNTVTYANSPLHPVPSMRTENRNAGFRRQSIAAQHNLKSPNGAPNPKKGRGRPLEGHTARAKWVDGAWDMIAQGVFEPVKIEPLAKHIGITKGSFYWHFKDRQELVDALVEKWLAHWELPTDVMSLPDPGDRLWHMVERVIRRDTHGAGIPLRYWSHNEPGIARRLKRADEERFKLICDQLVALRFSEDEAAVRARLYQAFMTGEYLRHRNDPIDERLRWARAQHDVLIARPSS